MGIPSELHLYPFRGHGAFGFWRGIEFMTQMGFLGPVGPEVDIMDRSCDNIRKVLYDKEPVWPEGKTPDFRENQCVPYLEWFIPKERTSDAIQIIYSGGSYEGNSPDSFEVAPADAT